MFVNNCTTFNHTLIRIKLFYTFEILKTKIMTTLTVQNLKCGGCAHTITKAVQGIDGVTDVSVDKDLSTVTFNTETVEIIEKVKTKLAHLGYPEEHADNTILHKAVSFVSCATGRLTE
jgi:copper chaperone